MFTTKRSASKGKVFFFLRVYECRTECYTDCNKAFFPDLKCVDSDINFIYNGNYYNKFYSYKRPADTSMKLHVDKYTQCKGFVGLNGAYPRIAHLDRQARLHTCFSYCLDGADPNVIGETRKSCVDLPQAERDQIICLYPEE